LWPEPEEHPMNADAVAAELASPLSRKLLSSSIPARFAYLGMDGDPRVVPVGFLWDGTTVVVGTVPTSAKVPALRKNPRVAITIDTEGYPPNVLLIRGAATVAIVDGVPDEYVAAARKLVPESEFAGWEGGVRALYQRMALITITPDWAKLLDFETTIPKAVADLVAAHGDPR
jgi:Pyridoxamine 5'-phosphate oxidase